VSGAHNSRRIRTYRTRHLKSFRIRTYKKIGGGGKESEDLRQRALQDLAQQFLFRLAEFFSVLGQVEDVDGFLAFRID